MSAVHNADFHSDIEKIDELQENIVKDMLELVGAKEQIMEVKLKIKKCWLCWNYDSFAMSPGKK